MILSIVLVNLLMMQESRYLSPNIYKHTKDILDQLEPRLAAHIIFGNYIKQEIQSP